MKDDKLKNMKKTYLVTAIIAGFVFGGLILAFIWSRQKPAPSGIIKNSPVAKPTPIALKLKDWEDPAGFKTAVPEDAQIDQNLDDEENYAHLELTHKSNPDGNVIIYVSDLPLGTKNKTVTTLDELIALPEYEGAIIVDTQLGGQPAGKLKLKDGSTVILALYDEVLFKLVLNGSQNPYWQQVFDDVVNNFAYVPVNKTAEKTASQVSAPVESVDEEEVLE